MKPQRAACMLPPSAPPRLCRAARCPAKITAAWCMDSIATISPGSRRRTGREVLKDPAVLPPPIRADLERRERLYAARCSPARRRSRARLVAEMRGRIKEDDSTVPEPDGAVRLLHAATARAASIRSSAASRATAASESILLDGDKEAEGHAFFDLGDADHSPDHRLLAWSADIKGSEILHDPGPRPRDRRKISPTRCPRPRAGSSGLGDSAAFYYVELDENHRPVAGQAPPHRHAGGGRTRSSTRRPNPACSSIST